MGLSFQSRLIIELQEEVSKSKISAICTVGGGSGIPAWQQIKADITGKTIEIPDVEEATLLGAAILSGVGIGVYENIDDGPEKVRKIKAIFSPKPINTEYYDRLFMVYREACMLVSDISKKLESFA